MKPSGNQSGYWTDNSRLILVYIVAWSVCLYGLATLFFPLLPSLTIAGIDLGYWFAKHAPLTFGLLLLLIFSYARRMHKLDKKYKLKD